MHTLPLGFPQRLEGPMAWDGDKFRDKPELYVEALNKHDLSEVEQAIAHFKGLCPYNPLTLRVTSYIRQHSACLEGLSVERPSP
jgi:hypothetical protein